MSGIDFGLAAADQYYKADDQRVLRDQQRQMFDWQKQRNEADLSIMPERTAAAKSGLQLQDANNKSELAIAPNKAAIAKALSDFGVEDLPAVIAEGRRKRVFSEADAATTSIAKLGELIQIGDPAQVMSYMNNMNKANGWAADKKPIAQVGFQKDPKSGDNVFMALDADGNPVMQISAGQIKRMQDSIGKTELKVAKPGDTLYGVKNGQVTQLATAPVDPNLIKSQNKQHTPAEIQTMEWLITNKVAKDQGQAWDMVRSSREKTRQSFILDYVGKNVLPGQDPNKVSQQAGQIYDELQRSGGGKGAGQSNTPAATTLDPRVNSLLGLPSP